MKIDNKYIQYMYNYPHKTAYRKLENVDIRDYIDNLETSGHSLYLHIPFCESKCGYCNLFSCPTNNKDYMWQYLYAVARQIKQYKMILPKSTRFDELIIGGGTPMILDIEQLEYIFNEIYSNMPLDKKVNVVIETAPKQTSKEKLDLLKKYNVSRISMGIQSFFDKELKFLKRFHNSKVSESAADMITKASFKRVNFDFIYGLPMQTKDSLTQSLKKAITYKPDEIFLYPLYIKHGVIMQKCNDNKYLNDEHTYKLYNIASEFLEENGYSRVSMRCFIKNDSDNENVIKFSECGFKSSLALGCGGRSYIGRLHTCSNYTTDNKRIRQEIDSFINTKDFTKVTNGIILNDDEIKRRYVIKHLMILPGIDTNRYKQLFNNDIESDFECIKNFITNGLLERNGEFLGLSKIGIAYSDYIGPQFISEDVKNKMIEWDKIYDL